MADAYPRFRSVVLDTTDPRGLAEFYRRLLGYVYREGDAIDVADEADPPDWLVLLDPASGMRLAFQGVETLPRSTWPSTAVPQQLHLDFSVATAVELTAQHNRALGLGAHLLLDRFDDPDEPLYVYADPAGHPVCIFVAGETSVP